MEERTKEAERYRRTQYQDNLARQAEPVSIPQPEIKPAPQRGVRIHSLPRRKSDIRYGWLAAIMAVAALYVVLLLQYTTLTELSLEASGYEASIRHSDEEISKMKKFTLNNITAEDIDAYVRANDMDELERSDVEYIDSAREEVVISYRDDGSEKEAGQAVKAIRDKLDAFIEFFR